MIVLRIYTTLGCHLCEQMEALVARLSKADLRFEHIEIVDDEALLERYGRRIPVLIDERGVEVLEGNVSFAEVACWLRQQGWLDDQALAELESFTSADEADSDSPTFTGRGAGGRRTLGQGS